VHIHHPALWTAWHIRCTLDSGWKGRRTPFMTRSPSLQTLVTQRHQGGTVGEFGRTSLLMLAASIGSADHWVMSASRGAITLTPLRMMSDEERRSSRERNVLLHLADLGYLTGTDNGGAMSATSPLSNSIGVLLFPWSLQATVAQLDMLARTSAAEIPSRFAPEDWLETWHHFVDDGEWNPEVTKGRLARLATVLPGIPKARRRHFLFGSLVGETEALALEVDPDHSSCGQGASPMTSENERRVRQVDPLVFTNPGSMPEG